MAPVKPRENKKTLAIESDSVFRLEPHVCRRCFGRIVSRDAGDGLRQYVCSNCGFEGSGPGPECVCSCGIRLRKSTVARAKNATPQDAGVRCMPNPAVSPDFPALYVASHE